MTRNDYMSGAVTHRHYYASIAKSAGIQLSPEHDMVRRALQSKDEHYNDIPLGAWDTAALAVKFAIARAMEEHSDSWSLAGGVCTVKEAVRQAVEAIQSRG